MAVFLEEALMVMNAPRPLPDEPPRPLRLWLKIWAQNPLAVGAVAPSGRDLARAMARCVPAADGAAGPGPVIELGGGTGPITAALLESGVAPGELIVIERDPDLHAHLQAQFPDVTILLGDARELVALLAPLGLGAPRAVISGLPLLSMAKSVQQAIVGAAVAVMAPAAPLVQFTYGPFSPIDRRLHGLEGRPVERVLANLPPATVWCYRRNAA